MTIREIVERWIEVNFTFIDDTAKEALIAALKQFNDGLDAELADCDKAWRECGDRAEKAEKRVRELESQLDRLRLPPINPLKTDENSLPNS